VRYPPDQKTKAREAILEAAATELKRKGFNGIGVDGVAAAAGVTSGAFYSNFPSKAALLKEIIEISVGEDFIDLDGGDPGVRREHLKDWLATYISSSHREDAGAGCAMPSLSADVARADDAVRDVYQRKLLKFIRELSSVVEGPEAVRQQRAWSIAAIMVGAISISRAMPDGSQAQQLIDSALQTARNLVDDASCTDRRSKKKTVGR
jgi:TetR/AcrR family transcriptional regulator, transcriptional repressor for nem operon